MLRADGHFAKVHGLALLIMLTRKDKHIVLGEHGVAVWHKLLIAAQDHDEQQLRRQNDLTYFPAAPGMPVSHRRSDKPHRMLLAHSHLLLDPRIALNESGAYDTGWDRDDPDAEAGNDDREDAPSGRYRIDVAVAYRKDRGGRPPDAGKCIVKARTRVMLQTVHSQGRRNHQHEQQADG